jgi:hypothetical protein
MSNVITLTQANFDREVPRSRRRGRGRGDAGRLAASH